MIKFEQLNIDELNKYDDIEFWYETDKKYNITKDSNGNFNFELIDIPYFRKNFTENTTMWKDFFGDLSSWKVYVAKDNNTLIGGCIIANTKSKCLMFENRDDLAVLWDLRVADKYRNQKIGQKLFNIAEDFCKKNGFKTLKIETQNTNVKAVNFYLKQGATLKTIDENAYEDFPEETQLIFYKEIM